MPELDLFNLFRTMLFVALTIYYVVTTAWMVWWIAGLLRGDEPQRRLVRTVLSYQLVTFRLRPLRAELTQIAVLVAVLIALYWTHGWV